MKKVIITLLVMFVGLYASDVNGIHESDFTVEQYVCKDKLLLNKFGNYIVAEYNDQTDLLYNQNTISKTKNNISVWALFVTRRGNNDLANNGAGYVMARFVFDKKTNRYSETNVIVYKCNGSILSDNKYSTYDEVPPGSLVESLKYAVTH